MKFLSIIFCSVAMLASANYCNAQNCVLSGVISDKSSGEGLISANISYGNNQGTTTNFTGDYELTVPYGTYEFEFSYVGYTSKKFSLTLDTPTKEFNVSLFSIELQEAVVYSDVAIDRETPVAFTNIDAKTVEEELASQDIPMLLNSAPGVYATQQGGGDGDARITIRGFDQRNVAVMLDGVPVNDMENGWVYWSNWFGLDAIMQTTQVQRGLGVSKLAIPSVGGTINIITKGINQEKNTRIKQEAASNGFLRTTIGHTSGRLKGNWGYTAAASYKQGNGWVNGNFTQGFFYYGKVQKAIGNHIITLSGFGAPQQHGQRAFKEGIHIYDQSYAQNQGINTDGFSEFGLTYNIHAGELTRYDLDADGNKINEATEDFNERKNYYHKPQLSARHSWAINDRFSINNVAYLSIGNGGGTRLNTGLSANDLNADGSPDFQRIYDAQTGFSFEPSIFVTDDPTIIPQISTTEHVATENYIKSSINNHFWYGLLSTFRYKSSERLTFSGGLDARHYRGEHYREVYDYLGADYVFDKENPNAPSGVKRIGDIIDYHNDAFVEWGGLFGQVEYKTELWSTFFSLSTALTRYKRTDYMLPKAIEIDGETIAPIYFWEDNATVPIETEIERNGVVYKPSSPELEYQTTDWYYKGGFTVKTGFNRKITEKHNVFINLGYLDRAPRFQNVFDFTNELFVDIQNEKVKAFEFGYGYKIKPFSMNVNGYVTSWENRPVNRGVQIPDPLDPENTINANINGMNARHMGIEFEAAYAVNKKLTVEGVISLGDWIWNSQDTVLFYYDNNQPVIDLSNGEQVTQAYDARGVHVGDAAQTQLGAMVRYQFKKGAYAKFRYTYFDRYYANFDPTQLNGDAAGRDPWALPSYSLVEFHAGYQISLKEKTRINLRGSVLNLLNNTYITDADDSFDLATFNDYSTNSARGFDAGSAGVFFGQGTRFNVSATLTF